MQPKKETKLKICSKCKQEKDLTDFYKARQKIDGLFPWCKSCKRTYSKNNYIKRKIKKMTNKEKILNMIKENNGRITQKELIENFDNRKILI